MPFSRNSWRAISEARILDVPGLLAVSRQTEINVIIVTDQLQIFTHELMIFNTKIENITVTNITFISIYSKYVNNNILKEYQHLRGLPFERAIQFLERSFDFS
jgi:hypothetical protein